jgi:hypothetical protein
MTAIVDIVNFNADASCLAAGRWLQALEGRGESELCQWLSTYIQTAKKTSLGFTGASLADIIHFNPEAVDLVRGNPDIFEIILRPFSHDVGLLRSNSGFRVNLDLGIRICSNTFTNVTPVFLPPEFMLKAEQIDVLQQSNIQATLINPDRFSEEGRRFIEESPYFVNGVLDSKLLCLPAAGSLTNAYLACIQRLDTGIWSQAVLNQGRARTFLWRDGESSFLLPDGVRRERFWLESEDSQLEREFVRDALKDCPKGGPSRNGLVPYPTHSFNAWMKEFRMLGFVQRVAAIETRVTSLDSLQLTLLLQAMNSDILSAVEKESPKIRLRSIDSRYEFEFTINRSSRGLEGEDFIAMVENDSQERVKQYLQSSSQSHILKVRARWKAIERLMSRCP